MSDISEFPLVSWSFANYIKINKQLNFLKLSSDRQRLIYDKWYNDSYDLYDKYTSDMFKNCGYNSMDINNILIESEIIANTFYLNNKTRNKDIGSSITQIWCETDISDYYGFHKLYRTIQKNNKIHTIYFGKNGLGCNADDYYTKKHLEYENDDYYTKNHLEYENEDNYTLFTPKNKELLQIEFEKLLTLCKSLVRIHICGYHFQCRTDTNFFKINKHIKVYKIYNYDYPQSDCDEI
jgi:hypothetical protein